MWKGGRGRGKEGRGGVEGGGAITVARVVASLWEGLRARNANQGGRQVTSKAAATSGSVESQWLIS